MQTKEKNPHLPVSTTTSHFPLPFHQSHSCPPLSALLRLPLRRRLRLTRRPWTLPITPLHTLLLPDIRTHLHRRRALTRLALRHADRLGIPTLDIGMRRRHATFTSLPSAILALALHLHADLVALRIDEPGARLVLGGEGDLALQRGDLVVVEDVAVFVAVFDLFFFGEEVGVVFGRGGLRGYGAVGVGVAADGLVGAGLGRAGGGRGEAGGGGGVFGELEGKRC